MSRRRKKRRVKQQRRKSSIENNQKIVEESWQWLHWYNRARESEREPEVSPGIFVRITKVKFAIFAGCGRFSTVG